MSLAASPLAIRPPQTARSWSGSAGSWGWALAMVPCAATYAANGASTPPTASANDHGRRRASASAPMSSAATSARLVSPSEPGTQLAATVELPRQRTSSRTNTASGSVPAGGRQRIDAQGGSRLYKSDSIPCPHQTGEVVALPHHVEIDVRAQVEAEVGLGGTEAGGVDVEGGQRGAAAASRLRGAHPPGVAAGRDHRQRPARKAADAVPGHCAGQRLRAVGTGDREVVEDQAILAHRAVRLQEGPPGVVGDQP